jgi:4-hydroxy-3-polyprenylbenzoate decarboxylase
MGLQSYVLELEKKGELKRVRALVDPELEISEIAMRQVRAGGPALLFENVKGSPFPLAINLNATPGRLSYALGMAPAELGGRLGRLMEALQPPSLKALWKERSSLGRALSLRVRRLGSSPVQQVVSQPGDLLSLPALKCWPKDGGRFITLPLVGTVDAATGRQNLGMYRMQVFGQSLAGLHWQIVRGAEAHAAESKTGKLSVAVALGGDPALTLAAIFPLPEGMEELPFAGLLRGQAQPLVKALTQPLWVPANAEFILEGEVGLAERRMEGPFGDHMGHYSLAAPYPVFRMTALTHRKGAIYPATLVGKPPQEDRVWGEAINEIAGPLIKLLHPEIAGFWTYYEAGFHNLLVAAVRQRHAKQGISSALGLMGTGQLALTKVAMLVDADVDPRDLAAVLRQARLHFDSSEDALIIPGTPQDTLDFTGPKMNLGSKLILDCTSGHGHRPEPPRRSPKGAGGPLNPDKLRALLGPSLLKIKSLDGGLLALQVRSQGARSAALLEKALGPGQPLLGGHPWVALVSEDVDLEDRVDLIWGIFTRFDAARDLRFSKSRLVGAWPQHEGAMGMDATHKPGYPEPLAMPQRIIRMVDSRWKEYGF